MYLFTENMLTSSSQYLHPEYLQPLPTTLDAKKSPLALLAQTCSSIGKDVSPSKSIIPSISKKDTEKDKSSSPEVKRPGSNNNGSSRVVKSPVIDTSDKPGFRTVSNKVDIPALIPSSPGQSSEKSKTPSISSPVRSSESTTSNSTISHSITSLSVSSTSPNNLKSKRCSSRDGDSKSDLNHRTMSRLSPELSTSCTTSLKPQMNPSISSFHGLNTYPSSYPGFPFLPPGSALDQAALHGYSASLAAHAGLGLGSASAAAMVAAQNSALKQQQAAAAACLSPYVSYTRVRTPSGATTLVPVCRDPYCNNCQLTVQNSHLSSTCNAPGCAQCAHEKSLQNLTSLGFPGMMPSSLPPGFHSSFGQAAALSSLYPHSALSAHQGLPIVCNWVSAGNEFCGKRFTTSEELLQHLRTHTTSADAVANNFGLGLNSAYHLQALNASGGLSPNSLRRSYPTSASPGLLSANRYHPYKTSLTSPSYPSGQPLPLGAYYPPYALYSQRLGAASVP
ncbi:zinc finger protein Noc-like [Mytilus trossulus]|uniref:zinc finger protein Noc-like n=1 Tax=Mytilus trossulus TaxID=6551 RepID=UPI003007A6C7